MCSLINDGHSDQCKLIPHCRFDLRFSESDVEHFFMCLLAVRMSSLEKCLFSLLPIFQLGCLFFVVVELYELFVYFAN